MTRAFDAIASAGRWQRIGLAAVAGLLLALGQAPLSLPWGVYPAFAILVLLISQASRKSAAWVLWVAGASYFAASLNWLIEPFLVDIARHGWMAPFGITFMSGGLALFWAAAGALAVSLPGTTARALLLAAALTAMEFARANVFTGFPWALLAYHWIDTPISQSLSFIGPHGLGLLSVLLGVAVAIRFPFGLAASAIATVALWLVLASNVPPLGDAKGPIVRLIQPNAAQHLKWQPDNLQMFYDRQIALTASEGPRDIVVWPETAVPFSLGDRPDLDEAMASAAGAPLIYGARRLENAEKRVWYNSLGVLNPSGTLVAQYDKHHLVPFGEYIPFAALLNKYGIFGLAQNIGGFGAGDGPALISTPGIPPFQPLICYEAIFPEERLTLKNRPDWLLHITNDAWFGSYTGPYQHLAQARARAIEQGLPLARAANTGISAMIDPWGRITAELPLNESGYLDAGLPAPRAGTFYMLYGETVALACTFLTFVLAFWTNRRRRPHDS